MGPASHLHLGIGQGQDDFIRELRLEAAAEELERNRRTNVVTGVGGTQRRQMVSEPEPAS